MHLDTGHGCQGVRRSSSTILEGTVSNRILIEDMNFMSHAGKIKVRIEEAEYITTIEPVFNDNRFFITCIIEHLQRTAQTESRDPKVQTN